MSEEPGEGAREAAGEGPAARLLAGLFDYEKRGRTRFRTRPGSWSLYAMQRMYGGQAVAQALDAARRTVATDRVCHSCHAYFVGPGNPRRAIDLAVGRDSDTRSFSARRVTARQDGRIILTLSASFQVPAERTRFQAPMPDVPPPEGLDSQRAIIDRVGTRLPEWAHPFWLGEHAVDYRFCQPFHVFRHAPGPARSQVWMRVRMRLADDRHVHQRMLAFASDLHILHSGLAPLGIGWADPELRTASLDHSIWFHDSFRADEWLLYDLDSGFTGHARTLGQGRVFAADGRLVATVAQEGLARILDREGG